MTSGNDHQGKRPIKLNMWSEDSTASAVAAVTEQRQTGGNVSFYFRFRLYGHRDGRFFALFFSTALVRIVQ